MTAPSTIPVPASVEAITPAWLTHALAARFPGAVVRALTLSQFIDGTAQKCRFDVTYDPAGAPGPSSLWVKGGFDPKGAAQGDAFANEVRFFLDIARQLDVSVPDAFHGEIDPVTNNGVVVLEDLILRGATFGRATDPVSVDMAAKVLSVQARIHGRFWRKTETTPYRWIKPGGAIAGADAVDQYFGFWDRSAPLPRFAFLTREQRNKSRMQAALNGLVSDLRDRPVCLLHGDSQGGNLFFIDGEPGYLDWQHCMFGNWAFDLAGFLLTGLTLEDRRASDRELLRYYLAELAKTGAAAPAFDDAWDDYRRYALWPFMWVMTPVEAHPEAICCANAERACAGVADLESLEAWGA